MQSRNRGLNGAGDHIVPINHYADTGVSFYASLSVTVKPLADENDAASIINSGVTGTGGTITVPAAALLVTTSADTLFTYVQSGG